MRRLSIPIMGMFFVLLALLSGCGGGSGSRPSSGDTLQIEDGSYTALIDGSSYRLEYRVYRPKDSLSHPLIIMTHGRNGPNPSRNPDEINDCSIMNSNLANQGYIVMMLVRRGYGNSDGPDSELKSTPYECGLEATKDLQSAVEFMKTQPYVIPSKIVVMGHSQGGWAAIAFSTLTVDGVLGTVNFSGGTNYTTIQTDPMSTISAKWAEDCGKYGVIAKIPSLWIYAPNDQSVPAVASQSMYDKFNDSSDLATFIMKPAFGTNGHYFLDQPDFFMKDITRFFNTIGFTTDAQG